MASFEMQGVDEFIAQLNKLENISEIAKECVDAAAPILENSLKSAVSAAASKGQSKGALVGSISATKAKENDYGVFAAVRPTGKDSNGVRNAEKLAYLHYGTSKQSATGCITKATASAEGRCIQTMQQVFDAKVGAL